MVVFLCVFFFRAISESWEFTWSFFFFFSFLRLDARMGGVGLSLVRLVERVEVI